MVNLEQDRKQSPMVNAAWASGRERRKKMKKTAIVINGKGGVGKDTLCELAAKHFGVYNVSSIEPVKKLAAQCGWDGSKDDRSRKFLSDLKRLTIDYNDYPTLWAAARYEDFLSSSADFMFIHIREPEEIAKFVAKTGGAAKTLLVRGGERVSKTEYGNVSDDLVEAYAYDYYFLNDKTLPEAEAEFVSLLEEIASGRR